MLRQSPSRNQRSKGIKIKNVLQICLLLAVCFWLIYQVKRCHDKKKEFDGNNAKISSKTQNGDVILRFGRKYINPRVEETGMKTEKNEEEEDTEENGGEEDQEESGKTEEREGRDDEIEEPDEEKSDVEVDHEVDFIDEEEEREVDDEQESKKDEDDKEGSSLKDHDHDAREQHYEADDASSSVTHDAQTISTHTEKGNLENSNKNNEVNNKEEINVGESTTELLTVGDGEMPKNGMSLSSTANEEKVNEIVKSRTNGTSLLNSRITTESNDLSEVSNGSR